MTPLTSQQRLQHRLGLRPDDLAMMDIGLDHAGAEVLAAAIERRLARLPHRFVKLRSASKYSAVPAIAALAEEEIGPDRKPSIGVRAVADDRLELSFAPLLWDGFSVFRLVKSAMSAAETDDADAAPIALLQAESAATPAQVAHATAQAVAYASPKSRDNGARRVLLGTASLGADADGARRLAHALRMRCVGGERLVREQPAALPLAGAAGNLSYVVVSDEHGLAPAADCLADQLAVHLPLAQNPERVARAAWLTMLPFVSGIDRVFLYGPAHGPALYVTGYPSNSALHLSASYAASDFDEHESKQHFDDVLGVLRRDPAIKPPSPPAPVRAPGPSVGALLFDALRTEPDRPAVLTSSRTYSRAELLQRAGAVAAQLPRDAQIVGILCANSIECIAAFVAAILRGVCYVPLDPLAGTVKLRDIVASSPIELVLCTEQTEPLVADIGAMPILLDRAPPAEAPGAWIAATGPVYRVHTSGTTGAPKPIDVSSDNLMALFESYESISPEIYRTRWGFTSSIGFDASVKQYLGPLLFGGTVFIPERRLTADPVSVLRELKEHGVAVLNLTPQLLRIAVDAGLCGFDIVLVSGDVLPPRLVENFFERAGPSSRLINLYGPTETTINAMFYDLSRELRYRSVPIGRSMGACSVEVVDEAGQQQPYCRSGSLVISGPIVTASAGGAQPPLSFDTGDQCFVWYDDLVYFVGRTDNQVKINGVRIDLNEVAQRLRTYLDVKTCYVAVCNGRVYVVLQADEMAGRENHLAELRDGSRFGLVALRPLVVEAVPVNVNGKADLGAILAAKSAEDPPQSGSMQDVMDLEVHTMLRTVAEQRGFAPLEMDDDLIRHGFDSLLTMEVTLDLNNRFGVEMNPSQIVAHASARKLSALLRSVQPQAGLVHTMGVSGRGRLFVLLPPILGSGLMLMPLAKALAEQSAVAVCSYPSVAGEDGRGIEDIADAIADEIRSLAAMYRTVEIIGYSMGGSVGFELCKRLASACTITGFTIIDKPVTPRHSRLQQQRHGEEMLDRLLGGRQASEALRARMLADFQHNIDATFRYRPTGRVTMPVHLFVCRNENAPVQPEEWLPFLAGDFFVSALSCSHSEVLDPPYLEEILASVATIEEPALVMAERSAS